MVRRSDATNILRHDDRKVTSIMDTIIPQGVNPPLKQCSKCSNSYPATAEYFVRHSGHKDKLKSNCKMCDRVEREKNKGERSEYNREYGKKYRQEHKEERKRYLEDNKEKLLEKDRKYKEEHREGRNQYSKQYRQYHKKEMQEYNKQYHQKHKEERSEYHKSYCRTDHGRIVRKAIKHRRRALKKSIGGTYTIAQLQDQLKRQKSKCYYCRVGLNDNNWHADHIVPITRDGSNNTIDNIVVTCPTCNLRKYNKLPHEWPEGGRLL